MLKITLLNIGDLKRKNSLSLKSVDENDFIVQRLYHTIGIHLKYKLRVGGGGGGN